MRLFVGNLPFDQSEDQIHAAFAAVGQVASVKLIINRDTGQAKGFGFVDMPNDAEAQAAIQKLNGSMMGSRKIVVNEARPMEPRKGGFGGGGGGGGNRGGGNRGGGNRGGRDRGDRNW